MARIALRFQGFALFQIRELCKFDTLGEGEAESG
jgi:hypothetical protein